MQEERRLEILGILTIALSVFVLVSLGGYNPSDDPSISSNVQVTNPMGILGIFTAHFFVKIGFGYSSIIIPLLGLIWGWFLFAKKELDAPQYELLVLFPQIDKKELLPNSTKLSS